MKSLIFGVVIFVFHLDLMGQTNWYVDYENGSDTNSGTSYAMAVKTVDHLLSNQLVQPGDTVLIIGEYHNPDYNPHFSYGGESDRNNPHIWLRENSITIDHLHGTGNQYITFKPYDSTTVIKGDGANILRLNHCSYLRIEGFEIYGEVEHIPISTAEGLQTPGLQFLYLDSTTVDIQHPTLSEVLHRVDVGTTPAEIENTTYPVLGNVIRPSYTNTRGIYVSNSHHIDISGNLIHHMPGGGLRVSKSSDVNITGNEIHHCSGRSYAGTHAIVVAKTFVGTPNATDDTLYSIRINGNLIHHNYNEIFSWSPYKSFIKPRIDEGKGISLQTNNLNAWQNGTRRILCANNICYWNGFSGLHTKDGYNIDFINNTCYMNSYTNTVTYANDPSGHNIGISTSAGGRVRIINNISVVDAGWDGYAISSDGRTTDLMVEDNLIYGIDWTLSTDPDVTSIEINTIIADPQFADTTVYDFNLQSTSPAIDVADTLFAPPTDYLGRQRDSHPDMGALEYIPMRVEETQQESVRVFPKPFRDSIVICRRFRPDRVLLYNIIGKDMTGYLDIKNQGNKTIISTGDLPKGIYMLKIVSGERNFYKLLIHK